MFNIYYKTWISPSLKENKPRSPNYKIEKSLFIKKLIFSLLLKNKNDEFKLKKRSSLMYTGNSNYYRCKKNKTMKFNLQKIMFAAQQV